MKIIPIQIILYYMFGLILQLEIIILIDNFVFAIARLKEIMNVRM